jgi:hypothetical protein
LRSGCCRLRGFLRFLSRVFLGFSDFTFSDTARGWVANRFLNSLFTVRSGTTRATASTVRESFPARSGYGQTDAFPPLVSGGLLGRATIGSAAGRT